MSKIAVFETTIIFVVTPPHFIRPLQHRAIYLEKKGLRKIQTLEDKKMFFFSVFIGRFFQKNQCSKNVFSGLLLKKKERVDRWYNFFPYNFFPPVFFLLRHFFFLGPERAIFFFFRR